MVDSGLPLQEIGLVLAVVGLTCLGLSFHREKHVKLAPFGWVAFGLFFWIKTPHYAELMDPILVLMCGASLPVSILIALQERKIGESQSGYLIWSRGFVFWAALPYLLVSWVPYLSVAGVYLTAIQAVMFLKLCGIDEFNVGEAMVEFSDGRIIPFSEFSGSKILYLEPLGEGGFFVPIVLADGTPAGVSMILACSGLQSMIIFVGAIVALTKSPLSDRIRALLVTVPVIHILNVFRNAGIIYLDMNFRDWNWLGIGMFDFAHSYAAKFGSLGAMFVMAIVLFELLPELHRNVLDLIDSVRRKRISAT